MSEHEINEPAQENADYKITVIGDRSLRLWILPEETPEKMKRNYQAQLIEVGASQMLDLIYAATHEKYSMRGLYIQKDDPVIATDLLKEYDETKGASDALIKFINSRRNSCHKLLLDFIDSNNRNKPLRIEKHLGYKTLQDIQLKNHPDPIRKGKSNGAKYWVCFDDCFYTEVPASSKPSERTETRLKQWDDLLKTTKSPTWILWNPRCFGDEKLNEDKGNFAFQEWLFNKNGDTVS